MCMCMNIWLSAGMVKEKTDLSVGDIYVNCLCLFTVSVWVNTVTSVSIRQCVAICCCYFVFNMKSEAGGLHVVNW